MSGNLSWNLELLSGLSQDFPLELFLKLGITLNIAPGSRSNCFCATGLTIPCGIALCKFRFVKTYIPFWYKIINCDTFFYFNPLQELNAINDISVYDLDVVPPSQLAWEDIRMPARQQEPRVHDVHRSSGSSSQVVPSTMHLNNLYQTKM